MKIFPLAILSIVLLLLASAIVHSSPPVVKASAPAKTRRRKVPKRVSPTQKPQNKKQPSAKPRSVSKVVRIKVPANLDITHLRTSSASAAVFYLVDLAHVIPFVDAILIGKPTVAFPKRDHFAIYSPISNTESLLDAACSIGPFQVENVLYQKPGTNLISGQTISLSESTAIVQENGVFTRAMIDDCTELKQNSRYVVFVMKSHFLNYPVLYTTCNLELGRFNTDGTDLDDQLGGQARKEALRQELTATYGVTFAVP